MNCVVVIVVAPVIPECLLVGKHVNMAADVNEPCDCVIIIFIEWCGAQSDGWFWDVCN